MMPTSAKCGSQQAQQSRQTGLDGKEERRTKTESLADHVGDEAGVVANVEDGDDPVGDGGPAA